MSAGQRSILIIGGSGFIGANLVPALLRLGHDVTLLNRGHVPMPGTRQLVAEREQRRELEQAAGAIASVDVVIDTSSYSRAHTAAAWEFFSGKTRRWIHLSSAAVYRDLESGASNETDPIGGASWWGSYGRRKSEADAFLFAQSGRVQITILRPPYLYGPHNSEDRETFVWARVLQNRPVLVPGDGRTRIQFLHVWDLVSAFLRVIEKAPDTVDVFNVAGVDRPTLAEWVAAAAQAAGFPDPTVLAGVRPLEARKDFPFFDAPLCVETQRIESVLGWFPRYDLAAGLKQTYASLGTRQC